MGIPETVNVRQERIERLLRELRYEIERGVMEREIAEEMSFRFYVPLSSKISGGVVFCEFRTRPVPRWDMLLADGYEPRLKLVK